MATSLDFYSDESSSDYESESDSDASIEYTSTPPEDLTCSICLCVFREPHLTSCCGNHFCDVCIKRIKSNKQPCPLCKQRAFTTMLDKSICRKVNQLKVKCSNSVRGCEWTGELASLDRHLRNDCQFSLVCCDLKCGAQVLRQRLITHKSERCPMRPFSCEHCGLKRNFKTINGVHMEVCPKLPVPCPNKCTSSNFSRDSLQIHLKGCPSAKQSCFFEFAGCKRKITRKEESQHAADNTSNHLQLVLDAYLTLKKEVSKKEMENEQLRLELKLVKEEKSIGRYPYPPIDVIMRGYDTATIGHRWYSKPFYSHQRGYKMRVSIFGKGVGSGKGTHISVFANLMKGDYDDQLKWPFRGTVIVILVNGKENHIKYLKYTDRSPQHCADRVTKGETHPAGWGEPKFIELRNVQSQDLLHFIVSSVDCTSL